MILAIIAGLEAMTYYAVRSKRNQARRQQLLMGTNTDLHRAVPLVVDDYLKQKTARATKFQGSLPPNWPLSAGDSFTLGRSNTRSCSCFERPSTNVATGSTT